MFLAGAALFSLALVASATTTPMTLLGDDSNLIGNLTVGGNVGVGTTSPAQSLSVAQNGYIAGGMGVGITETNPGRIQATGRIQSNNGDIRSGDSTGDASFLLQGANNWDWFHNNTTDVTQLRRNSSAFVTINSAGNVGIGTTSPSSKLSVMGSGTGTGRGFVFANSNNAEKVTILDNGNVGIGTAVPGAKLSFGNLNDGRNTADGITWYNPGPTSYGIYRTAGAWSGPSYQQLQLAWQTGIVIDGGTAYGKSGTILQPKGGKVGIGTTSPLTALHVQSTGSAIIRAESASPAFDLRSNYATPSLARMSLNAIGNVLLDTNVQNENTSPRWQMSMGAQGDLFRILRAPAPSGTLSELMRITNTGNVGIGIGTTTPTAKLDINGDKIRIEVSKTPVSSSEACNQGEIAWDANSLYVCVAANTWKKAALTSF